MPKYFAVTDKGVESVLASDIKSIEGSKIILKEESCVIFDVKSDEDAIKACYFSQSADRFAEKLAFFEFSDFEDLLDKVKTGTDTFSAKGYFSEDSSFKVHCERRGEHDFNSTVLEQEVGGIFLKKIKDELGFEPRVELKRPDTMIFVFINNSKAYVGIDLCGRDLSKRNYRIFTAPGTLNSKLYYSMLQLSGYTKKKKLVDLFSKAGILTIEAALSENSISPNLYNKDFIFKKLPKYKSKDWDVFFKKIDSEKKMDKISAIGYDPILRNLEAAKKNAKLAGVDKIINFSKLDLEWADIKLDESTVDIVISRIPCPSTQMGVGLIKNIYLELFHQAEFFLKAKGKLCVLSENLTLLKEILTKEFKVVESHELWGGQQKYEFLILERNKKI